MKLVMTVLVRNEADIIKENLDYHFSQGVDFVIATDNLSTDGSTEILREFESQGRLHYINETSDTFKQRQWLTRMARMARKKFGADWVINNDADEFWLPASDSLKQVFKELPPKTKRVFAERCNFVYNTDAPEDEPFYEKMIFRTPMRSNAAGDYLPGKVAHVGRRWVNVGYGSHAVSRVGGGKRATATGVAEIFHYPMRSRQQFVNKIRNGGAALQRNDSLAALDMTTWLDLYEQMMSDGNLDEFMQNHSLDSVSLKNAIKSCAVLEDTRVRDILRSLSAEKAC